MAQQNCEAASTDRRQFLSHVSAVTAASGMLLAKSGAAYVGADTVALEKTPTPNLPVHVVLLVKNGVHILEAMYLEDMATDGVNEFLFMASPLKIRGGTASPVRPVAVI